MLNYSENKVHITLQIVLLLFAALMSSCTAENEFLTSEERSWLQEHPDLTVAVYPEFPPYQFVDDNNEVKGIFIDYFNLIEKKIDYKFKSIYYPAWSAILKDAKQDKVDVILEIQETEGRKGYLNFTEPIFVQPYVILANKNFPRGSTIADFGKDRIVTVDDYSVNEYLHKEHPNYNFKKVINDEAGVAAVLEGEADAFISLPTTISYFLKKKGANNAQIVGEIPYDCMLGFATRNELKLLNTIIDKAITNIRQEEKKEIMDNWMLSVVVPFYMKPTFWYSLVGVLFAISVFVIGINSALNRKVKKKTLKLSLAKDRAEECDRIKTVFWRNIAHEVRTPMNGIVGFSRMLSAEMPLDERKQYIDIIKSSSDQLTRVIDDIVEVSRLHGHRIKIQQETTHVEKLLESLVNIFKDAALKKKIDLLVIPNPTYAETTIILDKVKLHKIVSHLLENALKFTEFGSVKVNYSMVDKILEIVVSDTGIGMTSFDQTFIFDPFSKVDKTLSGQHGGLGLGLTIAKENACLMGGDLTVDSVAGRGSIFKVRIPFEDNMAVATTAAAGASCSDSFLNNQKFRILIAEDSMVNYLYLKKVIERSVDYDFTIVHAENGAIAVDICKEQEDFDIIFMDIKMPIMDGYKATSKIKLIRPETPIIVQTAYSTAEDINNAYNAGCDDFLSKPIDRDKMILILDKYLKNARLAVIKS